MKFTLKELKDARGYYFEDEGIRIYPQAIWDDGEATVPEDVHNEFSPEVPAITGQALIEAIKERGGEVIGDESVPTTNLPPVIHPLDYSILNDQVFVRQAAIAAMQGLLIGLPDSDCGMKGYCHDAALYANELLTAIKEHEQKGI